VIHIQGISKQYGSKILFENADATIGYRSRVALIGPNGAGKSTFIRILLGQESADSGKIARALHLTIGHLAQETPKLSGNTILAEVMRMDGRREGLLRTKQELEELFSKESPDEALLSRYGRILEEVELLDEYRLESRAQEILMGMGFKTSDFHRSLNELSGGWLMRVALSRVLLMEPDLLLLDEPTNHLDLESLLWLEEFLGSFKGAMLLISHDTAFLNRIATEVLEIDQKKLWDYRGNLDSYAIQKQERLTVLKAQYASQQAKIAEIESFVDRFGAKATKARQAQSRLKQLEKMDLIELPDQRATVRFRFPPAPHSGREVVTIRSAGVHYGSKTVFKKLTWTLPRGSRIAVVGVNGAGKTTLLKLLSGESEPTDGEVKLGHEVKVGYYAQHQAESLNLNNTILQELENMAPHLPVSQVRGIAGAFLFTGDAVEKKCGVLSGGEKARVALAKLLLSPANFLILDEPTNHLDVESRGVLLDALEDFEGTLCIVSHDRSFMSPLVDSVLEVVPGHAPGEGSQVNQLLGSYDEYLAKKVKEASEKARLKLSVLDPAAASMKKGEFSDELISQKKSPSNNQKRAWEREREQIEQKITECEQRQSELQAVLGDAATYEDKPRSLALLTEQRELEKKLSECLTRWEELCNLLI
jgi:ATP-binding cassette subfamily F protein 3